MNHRTNTLDRISAVACAALLAAASTAIAQGTLVPLPPHDMLRTGHSDGYGFTAQIPFTLTALEVAPEGVLLGDHPGFLVRINGQVALYIGRAPQIPLPMRLPIRAGDLVEIIGSASRLETSQHSAHNSLTADIPVQTTIEGVSHTLLPRRWTWNISDPRWESGSMQAPAGGPLGRVFMYTMPETTQPEACCLPGGACTMLTLAECFDLGGVARGPGTTCGTPCPQRGACCALDGNCRELFDYECEQFGRSFQGPGTACGNCPALPIIIANCNLPTGSTSLSGVEADEGDQWSEVARHTNDPTEANTTSGFLVSGDRRLADNVVIPPGGRRLGFVKVPIHTTLATTITAHRATLRIWNGSPADPGSQVVFGDTATNRLVHAEFSDIYRIFSSVTPALCGQIPPYPNKHRRIQWVYIAAPVHLPAGEYWLDWNISGDPGVSIFGTPSTHPTAIGRQCDPSNADALQYAFGMWHPADDAGQGCNPSPVRQDLYFELLGPPGPSCYANCDASTQPPILNIDDFTCFINHFAAASALPHPQQLTHYANCDGSAAAPALNVDDFTCFINEFARGCE